MYIEVIRKKTNIIEGLGWGEEICTVSFLQIMSYMQSDVGSLISCRNLLLVTIQ